MRVVDTLLVKTVQFFRGQVMLHAPENKEPELGREKLFHWQFSVDTLPREFSTLSVAEARSPHRVEYSLLTVSSLSLAFACLTPFFINPFSQGIYEMRATSLESGEALGLVTYLDAFEDSSGSQMKDLFGWGAVDIISRSAQALAPFLQACRAQVQGQTNGLAFRFDVKLDVKKPGFNVSGLLDGAEREPAVAACLRDKINNLQIADFSQLRSVPAKAYKLRLGVQLAHGADGGAP